MSELYKPETAIITGPTKGGPLQWGKDLTTWLNLSGKINAKHIHTVNKIIISQFRIKADLVHAVIPITARLWHKPYVLTIKGDYSRESRLWRYLYPLAIRTADRVTVPSAYLKSRLPSLAKAVVIPNAVDLKKFSQTELVEREKLSLIMVTNFWYDEKIAGVKRILDIIRRLKGKTGLPHYQLTIVGDGPKLSEIKKYAFSTGLPVQFTGWIPPITMLRRADLFIYYSIHDNMPNAMLEALACGLPVLTNNVGAIPEMINSGQNGFIAQNDDIYIETLIKLLTDFSLRRKIGQAARQRVEKNFSWSEIVKRYIELYRQI